MLLQFLLQACSGLCTIYPTRAVPVPQNDHLLIVRSKSHDIAVGTWARVKNGKYKGDLAQVCVLPLPKHLCMCTHTALVFLVTCN